MPAITQRVTYAELTALIATSGLNTGLNYLITDRGDSGLLFKAASTTQLEIQGTRYMLCPATYAVGEDSHGNNWIGVWHSTKTANLNDLSIWNGHVWKCVEAVTEPLDAPDLNATNWQLIPKSTFSSHEYIEMIFTVSYDAANDWIEKQWDSKGNCFGTSFVYENMGFGSGLNMCDISDWNIESGGTMYFSNNKCAGIYNNIVAESINDNFCDTIFNNNIGGSIKYNNFPGAILNNLITGSISHNTCTGGVSMNTIDGSIIYNKNIGYIGDNSGSGNIERNSNNGNITGVWETGVTETIVDKIGT